MYSAVIAKITNIRSHNNADRLNIGTVCGSQVIISKDVKEGTLGIFYSSDGQLSPIYCRENNLYSKKELNKDPSKGGLFGNNRRVRAQKLRGEISDGFWVELSTLAFTGGDISSLKEHDELVEFNKIPICNKYQTEATLNNQKSKANQGKRSRKGHKPDSYPYFKEHWDTKQLGVNIHTIPENAILSISCKLHGTSARTSYALRRKELYGFKKFWNKTIGKLGPSFASEDWAYVSGTRRVVLNPKQLVDTGFYSGKKFRALIHQKIKSIGLHKGEEIFYEIVGYDDSGSPIMGRCGLSKEHAKNAGLSTKDRDDFISQYGENIIYSYGCLPGEWKIYVYRITQTSDDGHVIELSLNQVKNRCKELGLDYVPILKDSFIYDGDKDKLLNLCKELAEGPDLIDPRHPREGVVVRIEAPGQDNHLKLKGFWFRVLEGLVKGEPTYVDEEEVS